MRTRDAATELFFLEGGGKASAAMRALDWSQTALGAPEHWPPALRTSASICLHSQFPMMLWWGPELTVLYNDAYIPIPGHKHPQRALGRPGRECWAEIWDVIGPMLRRVIEHGRIVGVFTPVSETTQKVVGERRLRTLQEPLARCVHAGSATEACRIAGEMLTGNAADVPHASIFLVDATERRARRVPAQGTARVPMAADVCIGFDEDAPLAVAMRVGETRVLGDGPNRSIAIAVRPPGEAMPTAWIVAGLSRTRRFDADYRGFFELVAQQLGSALVAVRSLEEERRRAAALAEIDRAKTAFFSNVSHQFRMPLTLMLGPALFERFYRVENAGGRTHEGSGCPTP